MSLVARGVSVVYAQGTSLEHAALHDTSLSVEPGRLHLVLGSTGSGKSTLLKALSGLMRPTSGTVEADGAAPLPGDVGLVFQRPESQLFAETVIDDVAFGPRNRGLTAAEARVAAVDALREVGVDPDVLGTRSPFALSGGQARRVAIAGVVAMDPAYVLLDEPLAGLDLRGRRFVLALIDRLLAKGKGVVVVSHSAEEHLASADNVVLLASGHVMFEGTPAQLAARWEAWGRAGLEPPAMSKLARGLAGLGVPTADCGLDPERMAEAVVRMRGGA